MASLICYVVSCAGFYCLHQRGCKEMKTFVATYSERRLVDGRGRLCIFLDYGSQGQSTLCLCSDRPDRQHNGTRASQGNLVILTTLVINVYTFTQPFLYYSIRKHERMCSSCSHHFGYS